VAKLQIFCSEDLGAFYLDVLKDRLYTTQTASHARRSAQTALWYITQAMLRWMAPFLSFTAEEAWYVLGMGQTIFSDSYVHLPEADKELLGKWSRVLKLREEVNKEIELVRSQGLVGSSLQAEVDLTLPAADLALLTSLGEDVRFVFITSALRLHAGDAVAIQVTPSVHAKCERCWHYRDDIGSDSAHATLCGRCTSNLFGSGESRLVA